MYYYWKSIQSYVLYSTQIRSFTVPFTELVDINCNRMADTGEMETEIMSDIELSSDSEEEEEGDEVSLIVMKRPAKVERTVKDIEASNKRR